ncbi:hypothetical protein BGZ60DRAFT_434648 [Tricladium varicosporioides]|nr:hypothetical protein BGZ60DRAFT_434648 [Hymenoscyphus varicosporioides]
MSRVDNFSILSEPTTSTFRIIYPPVHHVRYNCDSPDCCSNFSRLSDLARHKKTIHGPKRECRFRCGYATARPDKMKEHTRNKHTNNKVFKKVPIQRRIRAPVDRTFDEDLPPWETLESTKTVEINQNGNHSNLAATSLDFAGFGSMANKLVQSKDIVPYDAQIHGFGEFSMIDLDEPMLNQSHHVTWDPFSDFAVHKSQGRNMYDSEFHTMQWM